MSRRTWRQRMAGPALLVAVAVGAVLLGRQQPPPRVTKVELPESPVGLVPEPAWLVRRGAEIPLTPTQAAQAKAVAAAWDRDTAEDRARLARIGAELDRQQRLDPARQSQFGERSAALAERRHAAWDQMWAALNDAQRQRVREMRSTARLEMR